MMVPNKADHKANAEKLMNYYYEPGGGGDARGVGQLHLSGRGRAARRWRRSTRRSSTTPLIFPDDEFLANTYGFMSLDEKTRQRYEKDFTKVIGA